MGQGSPGGMGKQGGLPGDRKPGDGAAGDKKDKKFEPPAAPPVARGSQRNRGPEAAAAAPWLRSPSAASALSSWTASRTTFSWRRSLSRARSGCAPAKTRRRKTDLRSTTSAAPL
ncbi:hypothetical protein ZWY2020_045404 [Hordeum vulgare]|nr:hypothetical protein ZWY2020_045404 [Hordeum vulgare]